MTDCSAVMARHSVGGLFFVLTLAGGPPLISSAAELTVSCGAVGKELELCQTGVRNWMRATGQAARVIPAVSSSGDRLGRYQLLLAARSYDIDVFAIDTVWPGMLGSFFLDLKSSVPEKTVQKHFSQLIENNTVDGKLIALPWYADAGLLYYRKDLLQKYSRRVPKTWQELTDTAMWIKRKEPSLWGYVFQGRSYEGLTCNAIEWFASSNAGTFLDSKRGITLNNESAIDILNLACSWIGSISPPGVLNYQEEEARGAFQSGLSIFMRNWPYAWNLVSASGSPVRGKVGIAQLPAGKSGQSVSALGGWSLAVNKYSRYPQQSIDLVRYLTSVEEQRRRLIEGGFYPTLRSLYRDPLLQKQYPPLQVLKEALNGVALRPAAVAGPKYNQLSAEIYQNIHQILSKKISASEGLKKLETKLKPLMDEAPW
jgi:trehalose/maltose transport system substrate-binding protein